MSNIINISLLSPQMTLTFLAGFKHFTSVPAVVSTKCISVLHCFEDEMMNRSIAEILTAAT